MTRVFRSYVVPTSEGRAVLSAESRTPRVLLFHGFKRRAAQLEGWAERIPDLAFVHLPGHSKAPEFNETTLDCWIRGFREVASVWAEPPLIVAESLGAIIAMSLPCRALIAVEPPLSVHQLWPLRRTIARARARGIEVDPALERMFETPFHWVLDRIQAPTLVLAGQEPLLPERAVWPEPSVLTDEDFAAYAAHPLVEARRIPGGHALMDHNPQGVMDAAHDFMIRHGYLDPPPSA